MKILMLLGRHETGKTQAINDVFNKIKNPGDQVTLLSHTGNEDDFEAIITYNDLKIGFYSAGDLREDIVYAITHYYHKGCDVLICANSFVRSRGASGWLTRFSPLQSSVFQYIDIFPSQDKFSAQDIPDIIKKI
ncbi:hypothetical protein [uncultured Rikenella sp.]|uniref:hypothetical protein n=1 Tax=uncultured Rikenella sp. TaxID=368003 RepID=UPI0027296E6D|nr:hypothetical protein [uncultured Rikenella sp.]